MSIFSLKKHGIVGINQRNLDYIFPNNDRKFYPNADSKLKTKRLAESVNIKTPKLIGVIDSQSKVKNIPKILKRTKSFVIKPEHGSGGGGILVINDALPIGYKKSSGGILSRQEIFFHCQNILSGMYSLGSQPDNVILEETVKFDPVFNDIAFQGVPDIRIIVLKGEPIIGMLRLPTQISDGKANLHRGGIGVGIDMKTGLTTKAVQFDTYIKRHPETGKVLKGRKIPYWNQMLEIAKKNAISFKVRLCRRRYCYR